MKSLQTSLFFAAMLGLLALCGSAWGVESSESIQGLISHWKFDEGSGTTAYDSAGNNDGTVYGAQWTTGQINGALSFDGVDDYVEVHDSPDFTTNKITVLAWVKGPAQSIGRVLSHYEYGTYERAWTMYSKDGTDKFNVAITDTGEYYFGHRKQYKTSVAAFDNSWHFLAFTFDGAGSNLKLYVDGTEDTDVVKVYDDPITKIHDSTASVTVGCDFYYGETDHFFNGIIDEVRIYDEALSAEEIWQLYQGVFPELVGLEIAGPNEVAENFSASYKAIANYDNDNTRDVTDSALWSVEPNTHASIDENGVLRTKDIVTHQSATILASYTKGDVTFETEKAIDIFPICPTGTALQFDGVDDYVTLAILETNVESNNEGTITAWVRRDGNPELATIFMHSVITDYDKYMYLGITNSNVLRYSWRKNTSTYGNNRCYLDAATVMRLGQWYHVAVTSNGSTNKLYINGQEEIITTKGTNTGKWFDDLETDEYHDFIGNFQRSDGKFHYFDGIIDEVAIYNRALSAEEIRANMHRRLAGDEPNLVGYWDFDEGEGQIVYDLSGNGNDGQLGSTPNPDSSDPAWVESDAPIGICTLYQIATMAAERALERKLAMLEELLAALASEWTAYEALQEWLENGDYGVLNKGDIVTAKQKIRSAIQHQEQVIDALEKSIEKLEDALSALGYEPEPPVPNQPPNVNITNPQDGAVFGSYQTIEIEANAWDVDGSVVKVEFFADGSKIGEDVDGSDGWKTNWYEHPVGSYSLTAKATDNDGAATTSPAVGITVLEAPLPGQASNPNPANGATNVSISADLSWTAGSNAVSHDVYFGTTSPPPFIHNQTSTTFNPGTMASYTTYYWRIDEVNPSGTTTGTVWTFRTGGLEPPPIYRPK